MNGNNGWINLEEASAYSGLSKRVLRKAIKEKRLLGEKPAGGRYVTKKAYIDAYLRGIPLGEQGEAVQTAPNPVKEAKDKATIAKAEAEERKARDEIALRDGRLKTQQELEALEIALIPRLEAVEEDEARLVRVKADQEAKADQQEARKALLEEALESIGSLEESCENDLDLIRKAGQSLCESCQKKVRDIHGLELTDEVYDAKQRITIGWGQGLKEAEAKEQPESVFDEREEEE